MDEIMQKIGASVVCEALINEGVNVIFGHPGGAILPFYDALWHYPQIRHVLVRHEQAAAHAAEAYARLTGRVGVCVATSGPGATNLMTGLGRGEDGLGAHRCHHGGRSPVPSWGQRPSRNAIPAGWPLLW